MVGLVHVILDPVYIYGLVAEGICRDNQKVLALHHNPAIHRYPRRWGMQMTGALHNNSYFGQTLCRKI